MEKKSNIVKFFWRVTYSHTIAYFIAGIFAVSVMNYREIFASDAISSLMLPVDAPIVALGPLLQILRGIIIALVLLPLRKTFFEEKHGLLKLGLIMIGFSLLSTFGPTLGSFEGYIYTKVSYQYQIFGYPEAIIYFSLFLLLLHVSQKYERKKIVTALSIIAVAFICLMSIMGFLAATGHFVTK